MTPGTFWMWPHLFPHHCLSQKLKLRMKPCLSSQPLPPPQLPRSVPSVSLQLFLKPRICWMISAHYKRPSACIQQMRIALRKPGSLLLYLLSESTKPPMLVPVCICTPTRSVKPLLFTPRVLLPCTHISGGNISAWPWPALIVTTRYFGTLADGNLTWTVSTLRNPTVAQEMLSTAQQITSTDAPQRSKLAVPKAKKQNPHLVPLRPRTVSRTLLMVVTSVPLRMSLHLQLRPCPSPANKQRLCWQGPSPWSHIRLKKP